MAAKQSTVELIFQGVDRTGEATQAALRNAQSFTQSLQGVTAPVANATKQAVKFEAALLAGGAAITAFSIKAAGDFDSAFREISTLIDQPIEDLAGFRQAILDYSQESTQPLEQITNSIYAAISAGVDYADSIEAVARAEQLAVAGKADLNDTLTVLVSSLNAYGLEMDEAERFSDALFTTVRQGQTTLPELGSSLSQVTGLAASAGVDFEELLSAVAALTAAGAPTSQAITQVRQALANIINPTQQARDIAGDLGIEFGAAALESRGLSGVLEDVAEATGGNTEQMSQLFGSVQALGGVLTLTGEGADAFSETLLAMEGSAGATEAAFENMAGTVEQQNQRVANALRGLAIEIGEPLLQEYGGVADALAAVFRSIGDNVRDGQLGNLVGVVQEILADTEGVLRNMAANMTDALDIADLSGLPDGLNAIREAAANLFSNQDLSTAEGLASAMTSLGNAFAGLSEFTAGVIESFQWLFDLLVDLGTGAAELDRDFFRMAGNIGGVATQINAALPAFETLLTIMIAAQGVGLINSTRQLTAAMIGQGGLVAAMTKLGGLTLAGIGGWKVGEQLRNEFVEVERFGIALAAGLTKMAERVRFALEVLSIEVGRSTFDDISEAHSRMQANLAQIDEEYADMFARAGAEGQSFVDQQRAIEEQAERTTATIAGQDGAIKPLRQTYEDQVQAAMDLYNSQQAISDSMEVVNWKILDQDGNLQALTRDTEEVEEAQKRWIQSTEDGVATFSQVGEVFRGEMEGASRSAEDMAEKSDELQIALEELASNERIKYMEFEAQMNVAELEAQVAQTEAVFGSIDNAIKNTGELIGDLFGTLQGADSRWDEMKIERQIRKENEHRDRQFELQERLTEAHIKEIDARTKRMEQGDAMIKIEGDGLQPHLEAFMWEILRTIQVRVNEDGLEMLTGV